MRAATPACPTDSFARYVAIVCHYTDLAPTSGSARAHREQWFGDDVAPSHDLTEIFGDLAEIFEDLAIRNTPCIDDSGSYEPANHVLEAAYGLRRAAAAASYASTHDTPTGNDEVTVNRSLRTIASLSLLVLVTGTRVPSDDLDAFITSQIAMRHVAGLSIAIIDGGRIVDVRSYGVTDSAGGPRIDSTTLFQAGSVSKPVAALAALRLVEQSKLTLDADVNATLRSWTLPPSDFTATHPVTLRGLLSHTAGLTVHGFPGYAVTETVPTLVQVLNGVAPANTPAIRNDAVPGGTWNYSGGGYTIMQQMVVDVTGAPFPNVMRDNVLRPLGMDRSSYEQPLPPSMAAHTAAGHYPNGSLVHGRWHVYPEMAAAGLWTTPSDLARFAIEVQRAYAGSSARVISTAMARRMLTVQKGNWGLGLALLDTGTALRFNHGGRDEGFDTEMTATANTGQGVVIMINANDNSRMLSRIRDFVAVKYHWPNAVAFARPTPAPILAQQRVDVTGHYELANNQMISFVNDGLGLFVMNGGYPDEEFVFTDANHIASTERPFRFGVVRDAAGAVTGLTIAKGDTTRAVPRIGPLFRNMPAAHSSDVILDGRIADVLRALSVSGSAFASVTGETDGFRHDFAAMQWSPARGLRSLQYVGSQDENGRHIERHGSPVARVLYYHMITDTGTTMLLVHLAPNGDVTDVDTVDA